MTCRDINGNIVEIDLSDIMPFTVFGMDIPTINAFRLEYLKRNGAMPITSDRVREVFSKWL